MEFFHKRLSNDDIDVENVNVEGVKIDQFRRDLEKGSFKST